MYTHRNTLGTHITLILISDHYSLHVHDVILMCCSAPECRPAQSRPPHHQETAQSLSSGTPEEEEEEEEEEEKYVYMTVLYM